jgi:integrase
LKVLACPRARRDFAKDNRSEGLAFHTPRHGAATLLLVGGVPDVMAAAIMRHADTKTFRRLQDVLAELKREVATGMDALLGDGRR